MSHNRSIEDLQRRRHQMSDSDYINLLERHYELADIKRKLHVAKAEMFEHKVRLLQVQLSRAGNVIDKYKLQKDEATFYKDTEIPF